MPLSQRLLSILVCPNCKGKLDDKEKENCLICHKCRLVYKIVDGIPVLLVDEAEKL
jgi:uncharacterized protein YbaR (Trm112 family)